MIPIRDNLYTRRVPIITLALIVLNAGIFIHQITLGEALEDFIHRYAVVPADLYDAVRSPLLYGPVFLTLLTSLFLHGSILHLGGNMLYLWVFGKTIEARLGSIRFLLFYCTAGIAATVTHVLFYLESTIPLIGASGAIAGVLGAYFLLYPLAKIQVIVPLIFLFPTFQIPALLFLGGWFIMQVWSGWTASYYDISTGIAWWAHAGGFVAGAVLLLIFLPHRRY